MKSLAIGNGSLAYVLYLGLWIIPSITLASSLKDCLSTATAAGTLNEDELGRLEDLLEASQTLAYKEAVQSLHREYSRRARDAIDEAYHPRSYLHGHPTEYVAVMMHSLYQSPHVMEQTAQYLHRRGMNVVAPLLEGHRNRVPERLDQVRFEQWQRQARAEIERARSLGKKVILVGYSLGGLLAVDFASTYGDSLGPPIDGLVLFSPALSPRPLIRAASEIGAPFGVSGNRLRGGVPDTHTPYFSLVAAREVTRLGDRFRFDSGPKISTMEGFVESEPRTAGVHRLAVPMLLVEAKGDDAVDIAVNDRFFRNSTAPFTRIQVEGNHYHSMGRLEEQLRGPHGPKEGSQELFNGFQSFLDQNFPSR